MLLSVFISGVDSLHYRYNRARALCISHSMLTVACSSVLMTELLMVRIAAVEVQYEGERVLGCQTYPVSESSAALRL